jgi:hypothetical protein
MKTFKGPYNLAGIRESVNLFNFLPVVLAGLMFGACFAPRFAEAEETAAPASTNTGNWVISAGGAVDFPHANWNLDYRIGIGSRAEIGLSLDDDWSLSLGLGYFHYQGNDLSGPILIDEIRVLPTVRVILTNGKFNPYLTGGAGFSVQFAAASGVIAATLNPDGFLGAGLELRLADREAFFFESNYSLMAAYGTVAQDIEAVAGLRCGF